MSEQQYISKITNKKHGNTEQYIIRDETAWTEIEKLKKQLGDLQAECDAYKVQPVNSIEAVERSQTNDKYWIVKYTN